VAPLQVQRQGDLTALLVVGELPHRMRDRHLELVADLQPVVPVDDRAVLIDQDRDQYAVGRDVVPQRLSLLEG
jgi:hypothetical protein